MARVDNEGADQTTHLRSLIKVSIALDKSGYQVISFLIPR